MRCAPAIALLLLTAAGCGSGERAARGCERGFVHGSSRSDGVFFAAIGRGCGSDRPRRCTVADARGAIDTEDVDAGIAQDCVAFSQYVGAGTGAGGECTGAADTLVGDSGRRDFSRFRCVAPRHPSRHGGAERLTAPRPGSATIEARAPDPVGTPPGAYPTGDRALRAPPWAVLVWRAADGSVCHEPGQVIRGEALRTYAAYYEGGPPREGEIQTALGSLRPDAKFGVGRQYFHFGRFLPYPLREGGSCGDPDAGAGLIFSRERYAARPDLGPARTIVEGVAGRAVASVAVAGRRVELSRRRAFVAAFRGARAPAAVPVRVTYRDGRTQRFPEP